MLVSVIIPCFNVSDCIERAVTAVLNQTYTELELICVDNHSTDDTWQKLERLKSEYPTILLCKEPKKGASVARNTGLRIAKGQWVQFLDADDFIEPEKINYQLQIAREYGLLIEKAFVVGQKSWVRKDQSKVVNVLSRDVWHDLIHGRLGDTCANLWSKKALEAVKGWDENRKSSQEIDLQFRLLVNDTKVIYDQKPLTVIYERPTGSISSDDKIQNYIRVIEQRLEIRSFLTGRPDLASHIPFLDYFIFNNLRLIYARNHTHFDAIFKRVSLAGCDPLKLKKSFSLPERIVYRVFGPRAYLRIFTILKNT